MPVKLHTLDPSKAQEHPLFFPCRAVGGYHRSENPVARTLIDVEHPRSISGLREGKDCEDIRSRKRLSESLKKDVGSMLVL